MTEDPTVAELTRLIDELDVPFVLMTACPTHVAVMTNVDSSLQKHFKTALSSYIEDMEFPVHTRN